MSNEVKALIEQARALSPEDRIALVEDVLESLDRAAPDIDRLWAREAVDRTHEQKLPRGGRAFNSMLAYA